MSSSDDKPDTVNSGPAGGDARAEHEREFDITGNVKEKGQDPSPGDRARGEASDAEPARPAPASRRP